MRSFTPPYSESQLRAFSIIPRVTSVPSLIGCSYLIQHIIFSKRRRNRVYHRLILAMSINDLGWTVKNFLSTWPIPVGTKGAISAKGNQATCTAIAFIGQGSALSGILYSGSLTLFFLMVIRNGWTERQNRRLEVSMHIFSNTVGWGTAIAGLVMKLYNPHSFSCGIQASPMRCTQSYQATPENPATCTRGDNAGIYVWAFFWAWLWATFVFVTICMIIIYSAMRNIEQRMSRYSLSQHSSEEVDVSGRRSTTTNRVKHSRDFAVQAALYCFFFFITWIFATVSLSLSTFASKSYSPLIILAGFFGPLQGFFNFLVYMRPRYLLYRKQQPQKSLCAVMIRLFWRKPDTNMETQEQEQQRPSVEIFAESDITFNDVVQRDFVEGKTSTNGDQEQRTPTGELAVVSSEVSFYDSSNQKSSGGEPGSSKEEKQELEMPKRDHSEVEGDNTKDLGRKRDRDVMLSSSCML